MTAVSCQVPPPPPRRIPKRVLWELQPPVAQGNPPSPDSGSALCGLFLLALAVLWAIHLKIDPIPMAQHPWQLTGSAALALFGGLLLTRK